MNIKIIINALYQKLKSEYVVIFKGGIVLIGISLIGLSQTIPLITKFDFETRALQYKIEVQEDKKIKKINCDKIKKNKAICKQATYQLTANDHAMNLSSFIIVLSLYFGVILLIISILGFIKKSIDESIKNA